AADGGHAHERIAEPLLPHRLSRDGQHLQLAAFGVEGDEAAGDHGGGRAVVLGVILPGEGAGVGVEGVELVAAEAAAEEDLAIGDGGGGERTAAGDGRFPAGDAAVGGGEGNGGGNHERTPSWGRWRRLAEANSPEAADVERETGVTEHYAAS